ncbi:hypothetical protein BC834DRAFT_968491 [Gloeopeniophorella convolvens]|nr:hypothetical protein BC834DRAFT_968491 [Gloeopeniophorella convolvens]
MAPNNKRKREDGADDDDIPYGLRQILPVANLPIDFADEPMDGMQYLFTVRRDARNLPGITRAANPYEIPPPRTPTSAFQTPSEPLGDANAPSSLPNEEWRSKFERHFRHFRGNITQPTMQRHTVALSRKSMPDKKSRDAWWAFLQGAPESVWNPPRAAKQSKGRSGQGQEGAQPSPSTSPEDVHTVQPRELSPALLLQLDHRFSLHLIMYFNHWFSLYLESLDSNPESHSSVTYAPTDVHMRWVFSLLTRIDLLCSADERCRTRPTKESKRRPALKEAMLQRVQMARLVRGKANLLP